jgi:general secretion pathway protein G
MKIREKRADVRGGFTLMEMLVVVAIILVLAGAAVPMYMSYLEGAKRDMAKANVRMITEVLQAYEIKHGSLPPNLEVLTQPQADGSPAVLDPNTLLDPWGHPYVYDGPDQKDQRTGKPHVYSQGPNLANPNSRIDNWTSLQGTP